MFRYRYRIYRQARHIQMFVPDFVVTAGSVSEALELYVAADLESPLRDGERVAILNAGSAGRVDEGTGGFTIHTVSVTPPTKATITFQRLAV